ncbi:ectonucleoside triphosphate diphosphohydrolase 8 isoform X2 [Lepisosteus oculatus]
MGKLAVKQAAVGVLVAGAACMGVIALILTLVRVRSMDLPVGTQYGMVFDAGSTHTALFLYQWPEGKENNTGVVSQVLVCDVEGPGISSYASDPPGAGQSLKACLDKAKASIPAERHRDSPVYLGATAGMRLLHLQNPTQSVQVLQEVAKMIRSYPFDFRGARIISGQEEGAYGWITINYLLEGFIQYSFEGRWKHPKNGKILGALDLGGASTQITFTPKDPILDKSTEARFRLYGYNYGIYTHSYLCYGKEQAMKQLQAQLVKAKASAQRLSHSPRPLACDSAPPSVSLYCSLTALCSNSSLQGNDLSQPVTHPCYNSGYNLSLTMGELFDSPCVTKPSDFNAVTPVTFRGSGSPMECQDLVKTIFNLTGCPSASSCGFNGIYQPPISGQFFAFSSYFYTFSFLKLTPQAPLAQVQRTVEEFCRKKWTLLKAEYPGEKERFLRDYCATGYYITTLLLDGFKFDNQSWSNIVFQKQAADTDIGWTLGYMLNLTNLIPAERPQAAVGQSPEQWAAAVFFIVFGVFLCLVAIIMQIFWSRTTDIV